MKCSEFSNVLDEFSNLCKSAGPIGAEFNLQPVQAILAIAPSKSVIALAKQLTPLKVGLASSGMQIPLISRLAQFFTTFGKPPVAKDASTLAGLLGDLDAQGIEQLIQRARGTNKPKPAKQPKKETPIRSEVVAKYNRHLEEALGDDTGFKAILAEIELDKTLSTAELSALSKLFSLKTSKTRASALKNIRARHQNLMTSRAKSAATAGRIAG